MSSVSLSSGSKLERLRQRRVYTRDELVRLAFWSKPAKQKFPILAELGPLRHKEDHPPYEHRSVVKAVEKQWTPPPLPSQDSWESQDDGSTGWPPAIKTKWNQKSITALPETGTSATFDIELSNMKNDLSLVTSAQPGTLDPNAQFDAFLEWRHRQRLSMSSAPSSSIGAPFKAPHTPERREVSKIRAEHPVTKRDTPLSSFGKTPLTATKPSRKNSAVLSPAPKATSRQENGGGASSHLGQQTKSAPAPYDSPNLALIEGLVFLPSPSPPPSDSVAHKAAAGDRSSLAELLSMYDDE